MTHVKNVGEKIRKVREFKNLSLEELADRSKLSLELIARIEENKDLPFLAPLIRIARSLGVSLGTFLDDANELGPVVARGGASKVGVSFSHKNSRDPSNLIFSPLARDKSGRHMEPFLIDIKPVKDNDEESSAHPGEEFIYVLSGEIEIAYGKEIIKISEGDSIYYDSSVKHHVHTANEKPARILAVLYSPY
jgi:quercetin dioxygenase-like cupin family protein/DNA-binding XRE family transcriptional regulator